MLRKNSEQGVVFFLIGLLCVIQIILGLITIGTKEQVESNRQTSLWNREVLCHGIVGNPLNEVGDNKRVQELCAEVGVTRESN